VAEVRDNLDFGTIRADLRRDPRAGRVRGARESRYRRHVLTMRQPHKVRIDLPLQTTCAYLYFDDADRNLGPWWDAFYTYLLSLAPMDLQWHFEPVQGTYHARPPLTDDVRGTLGEKTSMPTSRSLAHRQALRLAARIPAQRDHRLEIMYFGPGGD